MMPALHRVAQPRGHVAAPATRGVSRLPVVLASETTPLAAPERVTRPFGDVPPVAPPQPETAPVAVARTVSRLVGEDLADVPVRRDDDAGSAAAAMAARAFTSDGEVHLPPQHQPLTDRRSTALLAHELTHVAQQRRAPLGVADEASPRGRRLEAQARAVERHVLRHGTAMGVVPRASASPSVAPAQGYLAASPTTQAAPRPAAPLPSSSTHGVQRAAAEDAPPIAVAASSAGGPGGVDSLDLDDLARRLYGRLRLQLRDELLLDRERIGLGAGRW